MSEELETRWLGRVRFEDALALQNELVAAHRADASLGDQLLLLEHEPVYTIGRTPDQSSLRGVGHLPHPLFTINRGGQATYHGPGQLVGYPILNLRRHGQDLHRYLRWIEELLIALLAECGVVAETRAGLTGAWIGPRKIASIGVGVRHWISMHGFALNVTGDLAAFEQIVPCGLTNVSMTSLARETGRDWNVQEVAEQVGALARERLPELALSPAESREH